MVRYPALPTPHTKINAADVDGFLNELHRLGLGKAASSAAIAAEQIESNESPVGGSLPAWQAIELQIFFSIWTNRIEFIHQKEESYKRTAVTVLGSDGQKG